MFYFSWKVTSIKILLSANSTTPTNLRNSLFCLISLLQKTGRAIAFLIGHHKSISTHTPPGYSLSLIRLLQTGRTIYSLPKDYNSPAYTPFHHSQKSPHQHDPQKPKASISHSPIQP